LQETYKESKEMIPISQRYFALNTAHINNTLKDPSHADWAAFFKGIKPSDVAGSDTKSMGSLMSALQYASFIHEAQH